MIAAINLIKDRGAEVEQIRVVSSFLILSDTYKFPKPSSILHRFFFLRYTPFVSNYLSPVSSF
jgi:hypothetical protein